MGLFKNKKGSAATSGDNLPGEAVGHARTKKNELVKVLNESVWESVNEEFKANKQFVIKDGDGNTVYVALFFDTLQCGGLAGKEARKDEAKGSIIEEIKKGSIKTYLKTQMLADNAFVIIPDHDTLESMGEYAIFTDGSYELCTVSMDGMNIATVDDNGEDYNLTYDQVRNVVDNGLDVHTLFPGSGDSIDAMFGMSSSKRAQALADDDLPDDDIPDDLPDDEPEDLEDLPDGDLDDLPDDDPDDGLMTAPEPAQPVQPRVQAAPQAAPAQQSAPAQPQPQAQPASATAPSPAEDPEEFPEGDSGDDGGYDEFEDITEEVVNEYVTRRFYSDDLGLEVSTEPFDMQFLHGNVYLPFNENRGTGLLNEYISNLSRDANVRLQRMHSENLFRLRERYMRLIQQHCITIAETLSVSSQDTPYGQIRYGIEHNREENLARVNSAVEMKRNQLNESWNRKLEQVGAEAAAAAKAQYEDRYGRSHEADLQNLISREKDEIERDYQASLNRMNGDRRAEASKMLDIAVNETLKEVSDLYIKVLHDEQREQARLQREITKFIDDNRKDEKARIEALAEERRQTKKAEEVRREFAAKIKAMSAEFDMKKTVLQADVDRMRQEHEVEIAKMESEWNRRLADERTRGDDLQQKLDDLLDKYASVDMKKAEEYQKKLADLQDEKATWQRHTNELLEEHKKADNSHFRMSLIVIIAAVIAAIGIGFMIGSTLNLRRASQIEQQMLTQQIPAQQHGEQDADGIMYIEEAGE